MMKNLKKLYYKDYFEHIDFGFIFSDSKSKKDYENNPKEIAKANKVLCTAKLERVIPQPIQDLQSIKLKVQYPGLVTGVGIGHEASIEGEFKLGMHFDHTTGMPILYGSSVKGVLRNYFKEVVDDKDQLIEKEIFDGGKSIYNRDVFFDAVIVKGADKNGHILAPDSITPHNGGPFKNPIPITFMKIAPGCSIEFRFKLVDSIVDGKRITAKQKKDWFKEILLTYGIGAKTNVGYGQFSEVIK